MDVRLLENTGNFKVYAKLGGIERLTKRAVRKGMYLWARDLKATANQGILDKSAKSGRIYLRSTGQGGQRLKRRRRHQASAPGEYHANRTGATRRSIGWIVTGSDRLTFGYGADGDEVPDQGEWLEFGTFKMKPRPSLQNAIRDTTGNAETYFDREIKRLAE